MALKSGFERTQVARLKSWGVNFKYESLELPYVLHGTYHPDIELVDNGTIIELKGVLDKDSKRKMEAVRRQYPDLDLRIVFMDADKKIPHYKQTHGEWATKLGFKWASGEIPIEWINEKDTQS